MPGDNLEALAALRRLLDPPADAGSRMVYLWGPAGSGRTHLLRALTGAPSGRTARLLGPASALDAFLHDSAVGRWLVDDVGELDPARQEAAFHLFQAVQTQPGAIFVAAGAQPPASLAVMPELASRLGWGLVLALHPLSEADTARALAATLAERGASASADLIPWLMTHAPRNLGSLRALIDALDAYALSRKRAITLPLLREFTQALQERARNMP